MQRCYEDVRMGERLTVETGCLNFSSIINKVQSFVTEKTPEMRNLEVKNLLDENNTIDATEDKGSKALNDLSEDLSKNLIERYLMLNPVAFLDCPLNYNNSLKQKLDNVVKNIISMNVERFKNQHEDDESMKLDIIRKRTWKVKETDPFSVRIILEIIQKFRELSRREAEATGDQQMILASYVLGGLVQNPRENPSFLQLIENLGETQKLLLSCMECKKGSVLINSWPHAQNLNLVIHPLFLSLCLCIKRQINNFLFKKKSSHNLNDINFEQTEDNSCMLNQLALLKQVTGHYCSKITFVNLDGYDSPLNICLAKCYSKHIQYISFPLGNSDNLMKLITYDNIIEWSRKYQVFDPSFKMKNYQQMGKNTYVFPINSKAEEDISPYCSSFVHFIMKEAIYHQIRQFGPSIIVVSHSGRLRIDNFHMESILKDLSIITNLRVVMYNNFGCEARQQLIQKCFPKSNDSIMSTMWYASGMPAQILDHINMFLKITSGTQNLQRDQVQFCRCREFDVSMIMSYVSQLIPVIGKNHLNLCFFANRVNEFKIREKILKKINEWKHFDETALSVYYKNLFSTFFQETSENSHLINYIRLYYGIDLQNHLQKFILKQKIQIKHNQLKETAKYIVRLPLSSDMERSQTQDIIGLEFIVQNQQGRSPFICKHTSEVLLSTTRQPQFSVVYVLNSLKDKTSAEMCNYAGFLTREIEQSFQGRVILRQVKFRQSQYDMTEFHQLRNFNYTETSQYVLLFWPVLYDAKLALIHSFAQEKYQPLLTNLVFVAQRVNPFEPIHVQISSQVQPRTCCTCFNIPNTETIYIFGGFTTGIRNYTEFQTNITKTTISHTGVVMKDLPKSFFVSTKILNQNDGRLVVDQILNDYVRPRMEYEILRMRPKDNVEKIIMVGGIGDKYTRPYSIISHKGYIIEFYKDDIQTVTRTKLNNLIVSNLLLPTRTASNSCNLVIESIQNRRIITMKKYAGKHALTFSKYKLVYDDTEKKMKCNKQYQLVVKEVENQEEYIALRESEKIHLGLDSLMAIHPTYISLFLDDKQPNDVNLVFQMDQEQSLKFPNRKQRIFSLQKEQFEVLSLTTFDNQVYGLIQHKEFTFGQPILVLSESHIYQQLIEKSIKDLKLTEIYYFDHQLRNHCLLVLQGRKIAILHGLHFYQLRYPQLILSRDKRGYYFSQEVKPSTSSQKLLNFIPNIEEYQLSPKISFLFNVKNKLISLNLLEKNIMIGKVKEVFMIGEDLNSDQKNIEWRQVWEKLLLLEYPQEFKPQTPRIIDLSYLVDNNKMNVRLISGFKGFLFQGSFRLDNQPKNLIIMNLIIDKDRPMSIEEYKRRRVAESKNISFSKCVLKN